MTYSCIHQLVNPRHREGIIWASPISICEVYTHPPFLILLLYHHGIGQPLRVENLIDSLCLFELLHLIPDGIRVILRRAPRWLLLGVMDGLTFK